MRKNYVETIIMLNEVDKKVINFYEKMLSKKVITKDDIESLQSFLEKQEVSNCVCSLKDVFELIRTRYEYISKLQDVIDVRMANMPVSEIGNKEIIAAVTEIKIIFDSIKVVFGETIRKPIVSKTLKNYYMLLIYAADQKSRVDTRYTDALKRAEYFISKLINQNPSKKFGTDDIENLDRILYSASVFDYTTKYTVKGYLKGIKKLVVAFEESEGILSYLLARCEDDKLIVELVRNDSNFDKPEISEYDDMTKLTEKLKQINCNILYGASQELTR